LQSTDEQLWAIEDFFGELGQHGPRLSYLEVLAA